MRKPATYSFRNAFQENVDGDEEGDVCDEDIDNDGNLNPLDNCIKVMIVNCIGGGRG